MITIAYNLDRPLGSSEHNNPLSNQIYLVTLTYGQLTQASFFFKKENVRKCFFDIFNAGIAQCRQKLNIILGTKVVQF